MHSLLTPAEHEGLKSWMLWIRDIYFQFHFWSHFVFFIRRFLYFDRWHAAAARPHRDFIRRMKKQIMTSVRWISRQIDITQTQKLRQNNLDTFRTIGHRNQVPSLCSVIRALITVKWSCYLRQSWRLFLRVITRASDKGSWRFHNHGEGPYYGLLLVESAY